jgi:hypothetical protein
MSPNAMARALSTGQRTVTPKAVRTVARDILARFDKTRHPEYQAHEYTAAEQATLRKAFAARGSRSKAQPKRKVSAPRVRKPSAPVAPDA